MDYGLPFDDSPVRGDALAGPHSHPVAGTQKVDSDFPEFSSFYPQAVARQQGLQAAHQAAGAGLCCRLDQPSEGHQHRQHGRGIKVDRAGAAHGVDRAHGEGGEGARGDQRIEAELLARGLADCAGQEGINQKAHGRGGQHEHGPAEEPHGRRFHGAGVEQQRDHHHVHREERADAQTEDAPGPRPLLVVVADDAADKVTAIAAEDLAGGLPPGDYRQTAVRASNAFHSRVY